MSVVVAIKENNKIYIGADSQVTKGGTRSTLKNPNNYKIWKVRGVDNCLMAHVGNVREANIVRLMDSVITSYDIYANRIDFEFVVKELVQRIFEELRRYGYLKDDSYIDEMDSSFIFAYKDQLYTINSDGCVIEVSDVASIGSGKNEAIGSLVSTESEPAKERIIKAIKASATNDIYVDYPIILIDTENTEFEIINENEG